MKALIDLEPNDCRYVCTDDFQFCALPKHLYLFDGKLRQSSYCKGHHNICLRPFVEKKERA